MNPTDRRLKKKNIIFLFFISVKNDATDLFLLQPIYFIYCLNKEVYSFLSLDLLTCAVSCMSQSAMYVTNIREAH